MIYWSTLDLKIRLLLTTTKTIFSFIAIRDSLLRNGNGMSKPTTTRSSSSQDEIERYDDEIKEDNQDGNLASYCDSCNLKSFNSSQRVFTKKYLSLIKPYKKLKVD